MSEYEPGTVAVATVRGVEGVQVMRVSSAPTTPWVSVAVPDGCRWHADVDVTDVRPLVVLDLDEDASEFVRILRGVGVKGNRDEPSELGGFEHIINGSLSAKRLGLIADQIEAQTKPPRIPEPGLYGVVSTDDAEGLTTYRWRSHDGWHGEDGSIHEWDDLIDPTPIREGLS